MVRGTIAAVWGRCRRAAAAVALALIALLAANGSALAEKRVALVIGNDRYQHVSALRKAVTDVTAVVSSLRELGFTVVVGENQARGTMSQSLLAFDSAIEPGDTAFFFFAGHGYEIRGQNYLLPTDVPPATEGQEELVRDASFALDRIIDRAQARGARTAIVVLDACRNNPFARAGTRAVGGSGGLAPVIPPEGVFVLFSAGAKQTALDRLSESDPDPNSVFTRHFVRELAVPGQTLSLSRQRRCWATAPCTSATPEILEALPDGDVFARGNGFIRRVSLSVFDKLIAIMGRDQDEALGAASEKAGL